MVSWKAVCATEDEGEGMLGVPGGSHPRVRCFYSTHCIT